MENVTLQFPDSSARLTDCRKLIVEVANEALEQITKKLPLSAITINFLDKPKWVIPETGLSGFATDGHNLEVYIDPIRADLRQSITIELPRTLAHELHHVMRWRSPGYGETLFEVMVSEGLADHFDLEVNGGEPRPWDVALTPAAIDGVLPLMIQELDNKAFVENDWFFGSEQRSVPRWTAYTIGFEIVGNYLASHNDQRASTLYNVPATVFRDSLVA